MTEGYWGTPDPASDPTGAYPTATYAAGSYPTATYPAATYPTGAYPQPPVTRVLPPRPAPRLGTWGALVQVFLFADMVAAFAVGWAIVRRLGVFNDALTGRNTLTDVRSWDGTVHDWAIGELCLALATGVVFITWFSRARCAAEHYNEGLLRFGTGWAIGAWITPVLNLWRPPQMVNDVLNALDAPPRSSHPARRAHPLVTAWWSVLLAGRFVAQLEPDPTTFSKVHTASYLGAVAAVLTVAGAVLAMIVVGRVTGAADRRRDLVLQEWRATTRR